ncbi:MAG: tRNA 2-thiocytidine biosynthesis TtcA family protein [Desulfovibrio sp.]|nr:tRNA 2-thiocytidine biosynthesis TtcA family protein [Desulfovibrio sp.]
MRKYSYAQEVCIKSVGKAMHRCGMLWPGCRVGVAVSGGVDSFVLLKVLRIRQGILPFPIELIALHLNPGFDTDNHAGLLPWLASEGIAAHIECTNFGPLAHSAENRRSSPCFRCAWLRRQRLFELSSRYRLTHLAFGHNAEDLVSTFFLNLCHNGRVDGMGMNESFFGGTLRVIRPLLLVEKKYIKSAAKRWNLPVFANPCPSNGHTARSGIADIVTALAGTHKGVPQTMMRALTRWQLEKESRPEGSER